MFPPSWYTLTSCVARVFRYPVGLGCGLARRCDSLLRRNSEQQLDFMHVWAVPKFRGLVSRNRRILELVSSLPGLRLRGISSGIVFLEVSVRHFLLADPFLSLKEMGKRFIVPGALSESGRWFDAFICALRVFGRPCGPPVTLLSTSFVPENLCGSLGA